MSGLPERAAMAPPANDGGGGGGGPAVRITDGFPPPVSLAEIALFEAHADDLLTLLVSAANDNDSTHTAWRGHDAPPQDDEAGP